MNRYSFFRSTLGGALAAGVLVTTLGSGVAFAEKPDGRGQGRGQGRANNAQAAAPQAAQATHGKPARPGAAGLLHRRGAVGTVKSIDVGKKSFVLETKAGDLTITTNGDTTFRVSGDANATFAKLTVGARAMAVGERPDGTTLLAKRVHLQAADGRRDGDRTERQATNRTTRTGTISELATDRTSFKLTPSGAAAVTVKVTADTEITLQGTAQLANGATARVVTTKDASGNEVALRIRIPAGA